MDGWSMHRHKGKDRGQGGEGGPQGSGDGDFTAYLGRNGLEEVRSVGGGSVSKVLAEDFSRVLPTQVTSNSAAGRGTVWGGVGGLAAWVGGGRCANDGAPLTRIRHQQERGLQRPTERSDPTQPAKGRTGDCPGPREGTPTRRNPTQGGWRGVVAAILWRTGQTDTLQIGGCISRRVGHQTHSPRGLWKRTATPAHSQGAVPRGRGGGGDCQDIP